MTRKRSDPHTFEQRLLEQKTRLERDLAALSHDAPRELLLARIEQLQTAAEMYEFLMLREAPAPAR